MNAYAGAAIGGLLAGIMIVRSYYVRKYKKMKNQKTPKTYDTQVYKPVLRCSICTGEQVVGFKNLSTGKFEDVMLIRSSKDLEEFKKQYNVAEISKEY